MVTADIARKTMQTLKLASSPDFRTAEKAGSLGMKLADTCVRSMYHMVMTFKHYG